MKSWLGLLVLSLVSTANAAVECESKEYILEHGCIRNSVQDSKCPRGRFSMFGDSCFYREVKPSLFDQVMELREPLPEWQEADNGTDAERKLLAEALVWRIYQLRDLPMIRKANFKVKPFEFANHVVPQMGIRMEDLELIRNQGFLNFFQVQSVIDRKGPYYYSRRVEAESGMLKWKYSKVDLQSVFAFSLPKYGYSAWNAITERMHPHTYGGHYDLVTVFKPSILRRSTFSPHDSFGTATIHTFRHFDTPSMPAEMKFSSSYYELQVWGPLQLRDVDHFLFNCKMHDRLPDDKPPEIARITGKPVYKCEEAPVDGSALHVKGELLASP